MNKVDMADQLRLVYRFDTWMRKRKWWWAFAFWGIELLMINSYVLMCKYFKMHDLKVPYSHYDYQKMIFQAWVNPQKYWHDQIVTVVLSIGRQTEKKNCQTPSSTKTK